MKASASSPLGLLLLPTIRTLGFEWGRRGGGGVNAPRREETRASGQDARRGQVIPRQSLAATSISGCDLYARRSGRQHGAIHGERIVGRA
eukprot:6631019-Pyramimonas_sp.AAC.1